MKKHCETCGKEFEARRGGRFCSQRCRCRGWRVRNADHCLEYFAEYRDKHREERKRNSRRWYAKNKSHALNYAKQYAAEKRPELLAYYAKRYAEEKERMRKEAIARYWRNPAARRAYSLRVGLQKYWADPEGARTYNRIGRNKRRYCREIAVTQELIYQLNRRLYDRKQ